MSRRYPLLLSLVLGLLLSSTTLFAATISETIAMLNGKDAAWIAANTTKEPTTPLAWTPLSPTTNSTLSAFVKNSLRSASFCWQLNGNQVFMMTIDSRFIQLDRLNSDFSFISRYRYQGIPASDDTSNPNFILTDQWNYVETEINDGHLVVRVNTGNNQTVQMLDTQTDSPFEQTGSGSPLPTDTSGSLLPLTGYALTNKNLPASIEHYTYQAQTALYFDTITPPVLASFEQEAAARVQRISTRDIQTQIINLWEKETEKPFITLSDVRFSAADAQKIKDALTGELSPLVPRVEKARQSVQRALADRLPGYIAFLTEYRDTIVERLEDTRKDETLSLEEKLQTLYRSARQRDYLSDVITELDTSRELLTPLNAELEKNAMALNTKAPEPNRAGSSISETLATLKSASPEWLEKHAVQTIETLEQTDNPTTPIETARGPEWLTIPAVTELRMSTFVQAGTKGRIQLSFRGSNNRAFGFLTNVGTTKNIRTYQMNENFAIDGSQDFLTSYHIEENQWYYLEVSITAATMVVRIHNGAGELVTLLDTQTSQILNPGLERTYFYNTGNINGYSFSHSSYESGLPYYFQPQLGSFYDAHEPPPAISAFLKQAEQKLAAIERITTTADISPGTTPELLVFSAAEVAAVKAQLTGEYISLTERVESALEKLEKALASRRSLWPKQQDDVTALPEEILTQDTLNWYTIPTGQEPFVRVKVRPTGPSFKGHTAIRFHLPQSTDPVQQNSFGVSLLNNFAFVALFDNTGQPSSYKTYNITPLANDEWHTLEIGTNGTDISIIKLSDSGVTTTVINTQTADQVGGTLPKDQPVITNAVIDKYNIGHIYSNHKYHYQPPMLFTPTKSPLTAITTRSIVSTSTAAPTDTDQQLTANEKYSAFQTAALVLSAATINELPLDDFLALSQDGALDVRLDTLATINALTAAGMSDEAADVQEEHDRIEQKINVRLRLIRTAQQLLNIAQADARARITQAENATTLAELPSAVFENEDAIRDALTAAHLTGMIPLIKQGKNEFDAVLAQRRTALTPPPIDPVVEVTEPAVEPVTESIVSTSEEKSSGSSDTTLPARDDVDQPAETAASTEDTDDASTDGDATVTESIAEESDTVDDQVPENTEESNQEDASALITPAGDGAITIARGFTQPTAIINNSIIFAADGSAGITLQLTNEQKDVLTLTLDRTGQTRIMQNATSVGFNRELSFGSSDANPGDYPLNKHIYKVRSTTTVDGDDTYLYVHLTKYVNNKAERPIRSAPIKVSAVPTKVSFGTLGSAPVTLKKLVVAPNEPEETTDTSVSIDAGGVVAPPAAEESATPAVRTYLPVAQRMRRR